MATIFFVYLLTFANGKVYVGMSRTDNKGGMTVRYRRHTYAATRGTRSPLYNAWRCHGAPVQTILSTHDTREDCALAEIDAIQEHDSMNRERGYNLQPGGEGMHAPPGSAVYALMRAKVWDNPVTRKKLSDAFKGKPLSEATRAAHAEWRGSPEAHAQFAEISRRPEVRAKASERMLKRLDGGLRQYLSDVQKGRPKNISPDGKAAASAKRKAWAATPEGRAAILKGAETLRDPAVMAKRKTGHAIYLKSEANAELCRANSVKARRPVKDERTGEVYDSIRAASLALGVKAPSIHFHIKKGRFTYV